jgi:DtxR family Mn-dependent transcriptional regulator
MSVSIENFLKSIYQLKFDRRKKASSTNLSSSLGISQAAVTDMAKKLAGKGLIEYQKYKEISLTPEGRLQAVKVIRRHRLWESFLHKVLNLPAQTVHEEAEILEHQTSDYLLERIDEFLGFPDFDPHGDPIPDAKGNFPASDAIPLSEGSKGERYTIHRMHVNDCKFQNYFTENNIRIGSDLAIDDVFDEDGSVAVEIDNRKIIFNSQLADNIHIQLKKV